jgi:predicted acetyltransferase
LWGRLVDLDLTSRLTTGPLAVDDVLLHLLVDVRAPRGRLADNLWLRLVDLPAALAARRYLAPLDVVLEVRDTGLPDNDGRWHLRANGDDVRCTRSERDADVVLDVRDLAAAYLGGTSIAALAAAGLVEERRPGAVAQAAAAFLWPVAPFCPWLF